MNDILPPKRPPVPDTEKEHLQPRPAADQPETSTLPSISPLVDEPVKKSNTSIKKRWIIGGLIGFIVLLAAAAGMLYMWYQSQLEPVNAANTSDVRVEIESGMTPELIAERLDENDLIRNRLAFEWYVSLNGKSGSLQAGSYTLNQSMPLAEIVEHLGTGKTDTFRITFLPGATLADNKKALQETGYTDEEIDAAFSKQYDHPLFASKPANADLEGYIYGETYEFRSDATVEDILIRTFDQFETAIQADNLVQKYKAQDLTLYQGIILASIIQRESGGEDKEQIAQVFFLRIKKGIQHGSDVTYQYIADKLGVERSPTLDNPYNTRKYTGLPPGPIAVPGLEALRAVANPASGDYLYFLSGDDDVTYFARTEAEHEANIRNHCQKKCQII